MKNLQEKKEMIAESKDFNAAMNPLMIKTLRNSLYPGAKEESVLMALAYCHHAKLDVMLKPVHIVPMWIVDKETGNGEMRDVVMPGINLYRIQASRNNCAGIGEPEFGEDITECLGGVDITYPKWCRVTVKRIVNGIICEWTATERWKENYATAGKDKKTGIVSIAPNAMWKKRPYAQLAKCAEAQALRKAFPEIGSMPTAEEMEGKTIDCVEYEELQKQKPISSKGVDTLKQTLGIVDESVIDIEPDLNKKEVDKNEESINNAQSINLDHIVFLMENSSDTKGLMEAMKKSKDLPANEKAIVGALFNKRQDELRAQT